jgi:hypothetical protein
VECHATASVHHYPCDRKNDRQRLVRSHKRGISVIAVLLRTLKKNIAQGFPVTT